MNTRNILGMNARNQIYVKLNSANSRKICHSKFVTKELLNKNDIPSAKIYYVISSSEELNEVDWSTLVNDFVIKPTNSSGGSGIIVFRKKINDDLWQTTIDEHWDLENIKLHCNDILEGKYSTHGSDPKIIIEERIPIHPLFLKFTYGGTPDIRIIVFNSIPIMAMLRIPTKESEGRANLHQGAIGIGVDISTGVTTHAITSNGKLLKVLPGTKKKLNGIMIPSWEKCLHVAVLASQAANLSYCGVDLFIHKDKGPMVVELNAQPGLSIQLANQTGLKRRLERVRDLNVLNHEHGVKIARSLFANSLINKITKKDELTTISLEETATIIGERKRTLDVLSTIDTGKYRSSISSEVAKELDLVDPEDLLWFQKSNHGEKIPIIEVVFKIKDKRVKTAMVVSQKLNKSKFKLKLGRKDLDSFLVRTKK
jgi:alpha-L-glutamate ligase-like protein